MSERRPPMTERQCGSRTCKLNSPGCDETDKLFEIDSREEAIMSTLAVMAGFASHRRHNCGLIGTWGVRYLRDWLPSRTFATRTLLCEHANEHLIRTELTGIPIIQEAVRNAALEFQAQLEGDHPCAAVAAESNSQQSRGRRSRIR